MHACPCCKNLTLQHRAMYEICPVCWWEDDGQDDPNEIAHASPNRVTLAEAQANYAAFGAKSEAHKHLARAPGRRERPKLPPGHARLAARHAR